MYNNNTVHTLVVTEAFDILLSDSDWEQGLIYQQINYNDREI